MVVQSSDLMRPEKYSELVSVLNPTWPLNILIWCLNICVGNPVFTDGVEKLSVAKLSGENKLDVADLRRFVFFAPSILFAYIGSKSRHIDAAFISHFLFLDHLVHLDPFTHFDLRASFVIF